MNIGVTFLPLYILFFVVKKGDKNLVFNPRGAHLPPVLANKFGKVVFDPFPRYLKWLHKVPQL